MDVSREVGRERNKVLGQTFVCTGDLAQTMKVVYGDQLKGNNGHPLGEIRDKKPRFTKERDQQRDKSKTCKQSGVRGRMCKRSGVKRTHMPQLTSEYSLDASATTVWSL